MTRLTGSPKKRNRLICGSTCLSEVILTARKIQNAYPDDPVVANP